MNQTMPKALNPRVYLSLALGIVLIYLTYFKYVYTPWNNAGGLNMPELGLTLVTFLLYIPIIVSLVIALIFPRKGPVLTTLSILLAYVFLTWVISWPLIIALSLVYKVYSKIENRESVKRLKFGCMIISFILVLNLISIGMDVNYYTLTLTDRINRLGTDLNHQILTLLIILEGDWLIMGSFLLMFFRNKIALIAMILITFLYCFVVDYMWVIALLYIALFVYIQTRDRQLRKKLQENS